MKENLDINQKQVWNAIAEEWHEFKKNPSELSKDFLKKCSGNVLDLGSGSGRHLIKIPHGKMYLVDFSEEMIELAKKRAKEKKIDAEFFVSDITKLPFEDNFFDYAICMHSLYCIKNSKNRKKAIKEVYRVLKPKARMLISVWNKNSERFRNDSKEKYVKWTNKGERYYYLFDEEELRNLLEKNKFKILEKIDSNVNITFIVQK